MEINPNDLPNRNGHSLFLGYCPLGKININQILTILSMYNYNLLESL